MSAISTDVFIVGAGLVGSSVAMHLGTLGRRDCIVADIDLAGGFSSSELNAGGVRATWNHPINAALSKISIRYFESVASEVGFLQKGYFWMYDKESWPKAKQTLQKNVNMNGLGVEYLSPQEIRARYSFIDKVEDLGGATFSPKDGLLNPNLLKLHFRDIAKNNGIQFMDRLWIRSAQKKSDGWRLVAHKFPANLSEDALKEILTYQDSGSGSFEEVVIDCKVLVNCSGAWANRFAKMLGLTPHCHAVRRQVSFFDCKDVDLRDFGMFVDASGVYFHPEGPSILSGFALHNEPIGYNLDYDGESFFNEHIWSALYERSSKFENLKHLTGWGGLYEVSEDMCAIIGKIDGTDRAYEAHSFSGRGAMQAYAAGLALAELLHFGNYRTLDLSDLNGGRFAKGNFVRENLLI